VLGLLLAAVFPAAGQQGTETRPLPAGPGPDVRPLPPGKDGEVVLQATLRQAEEWMRLHLPGRAITLLEPLHQERPAETTISLMLAEAYVGAGRHQDAAAIYRAEAARGGAEDPSLWMRLAHTLQLAGQGRQAVEVLLECSRRQPETTPHLLDAFQLLASDSLAGKEARATLEAATRDPDSPIAWSEIVAQSEAIAGDGAKALELTLRLERRQSSGGLRLLQLAGALVRGHQPELALAAYDSVLSVPARPNRGEEALTEKARLLESLHRAREAADAYAECERRFPDGVLSLRGTLRRAHLLLTELGDPAGGREAFGRVVARVGRNPRQEMRGLRDEARLGLAECDLQSGELARADSAYAVLAETAASGTAREEAAYQRAELLFYQARFTEAEEAYYQVTDKFPEGAWNNDALQRALLLGENAVAPQALEPLAHALYQLRTGHPDEALASCDEGLAQFDSTAAGAELWRVKIALLAQRGAWAEADASLARLGAVHPASRAVPAALLDLGERAEADPAQAARAHGYYERIVLEHPGSFEARRARAWFEAQRAAGETS
jgi:tetratricopeptide (TPR) repeat protein